MKAVRFHDAARVELLREIQYYTDISPKLGEGLAVAVEQAAQLASQFPDMGARHKYGTRRVFPKKFPFSIVYIVREAEVYIVAIAPFRRKPAYWSERTK